ncbi:MAG: 30S ribosomal protein S1, partial [Anaerolineales bacterium]|nr:30S ribosomal protein S1 [Anaerolineales bacterium]
MEESQGVVGQQGNGQEVDEGAVNPMAELLKTSFQYQELHHGDVVEGTIVHVSDAEVLIDIGSKSEGILAGRERERIGPEASSEIQVGQKVLVYVLNPEDKNGNVILSLSHAQLERDWREAERRFQAGEIFACTVSSYNKGGLIAHVGKVRGFIPASQLITMPRGIENDEKRAEELTKLLGQEFQLKIIEVDRKRNRLILSQRAAARESRQEQREKLLIDLVEGSTVSGRVSNLCDFGAFVNLGGADGLIHISELSWGRVTHPQEILSVGDEVEVFVLNVEPDRQRIGLSLKRLQSEPWAQVEEKYTVEQLVQGKVTKLTTFGAFVRLDSNIEGLIHISELADRHVNHPKEILKEGEDVSVRIIRIDPERKRIGLSLKGAEEHTELDWQEAVEGEEMDWEEATLAADETVAAADEGVCSLDEPGPVAVETIEVVDEVDVISDESEPVAVETIEVVDEVDVIPDELDSVAVETIANVDEVDVVSDESDSVAMETIADVDEVDVTPDDLDPVAVEAVAVVDEVDVVSDESEPVAVETVAVVDEVDVISDESDSVAVETIADVDEVDV